MTQTPDISFSNMKSLGDISGIALKLMFMDAHLKCENHIELFGEMFQRRLNLLKAAIATVIDASLEKEMPLTDVQPVFTPYMPRNVKEEIEILTTATATKAVMSVQTAIENNPLVGSVEDELSRMEEEAAADTQRMQNSILGTSNP